MSKIALIFPGQGSQFVGMGKSVYHEVLTETIKMINEKVNFPLLDMMFNGPIEKLNQTKYTQPAAFIASIMLLLTLEKFCGEAFWKDVVCVAGHSVGEYAAMVASGCLSIEDALDLIKVRAIAMEESSPKNDQNEPIGGMHAILGCNKEIIEEIIEKNYAKDAKRCAIANYNCPGQIVVTGLLEEGINVACQLALEHGARKHVRLNVSGPFHSQWMEPARLRLMDMISNIMFSQCKVPVISNVNAQAITSTEDFNRLIPLQVISPVRWEECVNTMVRMGVDTFVEIGAGKVLSGISRYCAPDKCFISIQTIEDVNLYANK
jgi:[acyl-carrier-protein] S-malonyltransferase